MTEEQKTPDQIIQEENQKNADLTKHIIQGHNDTFEKEYDFSKELGIDPFTIKLKAPTMLDQAKIQAIYERYFDGMGSFLPPSQMKLAYSLMANIEYQLKKYEGTDKVHVPEFLSDIDKLYNLSIPAKIGSDFGEWLDSFRY